jgi:hypothetical protein
MKDPEPRKKRQADMKKKDKNIIYSSKHIRLVNLLHDKSVHPPDPLPK